MRGSAWQGAPCTESEFSLLDRDPTTGTWAQYSFVPGRGTPVILDADQPRMHNMTSTKQNVSRLSGLVGLAVNTGTRTYWHHYDLLGGTPPPPPPARAPDADFTANVVRGIAPLNVAFTDTSTNAPWSWSWSFGDGTTSPEQSPWHTYAAPGTYTVMLTATNAGGPNTRRRRATSSWTPRVPSRSARRR